MSAWTAADAPSQIVTLPQRDSNFCVGLLESLVCVLWSIFKTFLIHKNIVYHQTPDRPPSGHLLVAMYSYVSELCIIAMYYSYVLKLCIMAMYYGYVL